MADGQGFARRVTRENLERFAPLLRETPRDDQETNDAGGEAEDGEENGGAVPTVAEVLRDPALADAEEQFQGDHIQVDLPYERPRLPRRTRRPRRPIAPQPAGQPVGTGNAVAAQQVGPLFWEKRSLPASDVQRQPGNPTGGVRLTQAGFRTPGGDIIDQTTYFRDDVFGNQDWAVGQQEPYREDAWVEFDVTILGHRFGVLRLKVSHKPSGEAGQGNYTTTLHWGDLGDRVRELNLIGRSLRIHGPLPGQLRPYYLEIS